MRLLDDNDLQIRISGSQVVLSRLLVECGDTRVPDKKITRPAVV